MKVLVDTSIWSFALRRKSPVASAEVDALNRLLHEDRAHIIGAIRQELLSGISDQNTFNRLARHLDAFVDLPLDTSDFVRAATFFNTCRQRGVQSSNTDFLICAAATRYGMAIYTADADFERFAVHLPIRLHSAASP